MRFFKAITEAWRNRRVRTDLLDTDPIATPTYRLTSLVEIVAESDFPYFPYKQSIKRRLGSIAKLVDEKLPEERDSFLKLLDQLKKQTREVQDNVTKALEELEQGEDESHHSKYMKSALRILGREDVLSAIKKVEDKWGKIRSKLRFATFFTPLLLSAIAVNSPSELNGTIEWINDATPAQTERVIATSIIVTLIGIIGKKYWGGLHTLDQEIIAEFLKYMKTEQNEQEFKKELRRLLDWADEIVNVDYSTR